MDGFEGIGERLTEGVLVAGDQDVAVVEGCGVEADENIFGTESGERKVLLLESLDELLGGLDGGLVDPGGGRGGSRHGCSIDVIIEDGDIDSIVDVVEGYISPRYAPLPISKL